MSKEHTNIKTKFAYLIHHTDIVLVCLVCVACGGACVLVYLCTPHHNTKDLKNINKVVRCNTFVPYFCYKGTTFFPLCKFLHYKNTYA